MIRPNGDKKTLPEQLPGNHEVDGLMAPMKNKIAKNDSRT